MTDTLQHLRTTLSDRYEIHGLVGRGGMATVYLATDRKHDRRVAIKVLAPELAASVGADRFLREIEIAAKLQHPHILPVYDSGEAHVPLRDEADDGTATEPLLYYVMPYVEGESLQDLIERRGRIPMEEALSVAREIASALDYAHRQGVVHRDIKPANVLLSDGHAVVADFGVARAIRASGDATLTHAGVAVGTPWYMSPEQALGESDLDGRADVYALGCVLYQMLTGDPPYTGPTPQSVIAKTITSDVPRLEGGPAALRRALERAMAKDRADRYASAGELERVLADLARDGSGRNRWWAVPATAAALLVAGLVAAFLLRPRDELLAVEPAAEQIAVMPFSTIGESVEVLGEGMVDLLGRNLDAVGGIRMVDPRRVLNRWHETVDGEPLSLDGALAIGRDLDAGSILTGSVVEAGQGVRLTATLARVDGTEMASASIDGPAMALLSLVDSLSVRLLREIWRSRVPVPSLRVSAITSGSLEAIRHYLRGAHYFRRGVFDSAAAALERAVEEDSTFALAHVQLANTYGWLEEYGSPNWQRHLAAASRHLDRLPTRERIIAAAADVFPTQPFAALDSMRSFTRRFPNDPYGWDVLGEVQFHLKGLLTVSLSELYRPFERALAIDPTYTPAYFHPLELAIADADTARLHRYLAAIEPDVAGDFLNPFLLAESIIWGDADSAADRFLRLGQRWPSRIPALVSAAHRAGPDARLRILDALRSARARSDAGSPLQHEVTTHLVRLHQALGQLEAAVTVARTAADEDPEPDIRLLASLASALFLADSTTRSAIARLEREAPFEADYYMALAFAEADRRQDLERTLERYRQRDTAQASPRLRIAMHALSGLETAMRGDTVAGLRIMRDAFRRGTIFDVTARQLSPIRLHYARLLAFHNDTHREGVQLLQHGFTEGVIHDFAVLPAALLAQARAHWIAGNADAAAEPYHRLLDLWSNADAALSPIIREARTRTEGVERSVDAGS